MRYRLMASFQGAAYQAGVGPSDEEVTLFAACPPPEELGFRSSSGHWRKRVSVEEIDSLWESRPIGRYRGERCMVLDDLGDRLHICYLGQDLYMARRLGFWEVDRGVFEVVVPRQEIDDLREERGEFELAIIDPADGDPQAAWNAAPRDAWDFPDNRPRNLIDTGPSWAADPNAPYDAGAWEDRDVNAQDPRDTGTWAAVRDENFVEPGGPYPRGRGGWRARDTGGWEAPDTGSWDAREVAERAAREARDMSGTGAWDARDMRDTGTWDARDMRDTGTWDARDMRDTGAWDARDMPDTSGWAAREVTDRAAARNSRDPGSGGWGGPDMPGSGGWPEQNANANGRGTNGTSSTGDRAARDMTDYAARDMTDYAARDMTDYAARDMTDYAVQDVTDRGGRDLSDTGGWAVRDMSDTGGWAARDVTGRGAREPRAARDPRTPGDSPLAPGDGALAPGDGALAPLAPGGRGDTDSWNGRGMTGGPPPRDARDMSDTGSWDARDLPDTGSWAAREVTGRAARNGPAAGSGGWGEVVPYNRRETAGWDPQDTVAWDPGPEWGQGQVIQPVRPQQTPDAAAVWHGSPAPEDADLWGPAAPPPANAPAPNGAMPSGIAPNEAPPNGAGTGVAATVGSTNDAPADPREAASPNEYAAMVGRSVGRRSARKPRVTTQAIFSQLLDLASIPQSAYAVDDEVDGAMCLVRNKDGFEVFSASDQARHEVRYFEDEEAAYFYLFGILAAEAVRSGHLGPKSPYQRALEPPSQ